MTLTTDIAPSSPNDERASVTPKSEYPRPDLDRSERWLSLNGLWDFSSIDGSTRITVPFAWETPASGVQRTWLESATYKRIVSLPSSWAGSRVVLCFGAVHHRAAVSIDGVIVGEHVGGYTSFEFDVTSHVHAGSDFTVEVAVESPADKRSIVHGKQRSIPRDDYDGVSFTPTSGIWQSVWIEARGRTYAQSVTLRGDSLTGIDVAVELAGDAPRDAPVRIQLLGARAGEPIVLELTGNAEGTATGRIELLEPRLWSPVDPHLYRVEVSVGEDAAADRVVATTGLRSIESRDGLLYLNGERLFLRGVLDQGYWPDTGLTAPSDEALVDDLYLARELGYTMVRKHLKLEEPRWLHRADEIGMLVWAEPAAPSRFSPEAAALFEDQLEPMVARDGNHPSIVVWGLYNEEWGLDWDIPGSRRRADAAVHAYDRMASIDHTRPLVENSGWAHVKSDIVDWHYYEPNPAIWAASVRDLASGERETFPVKLGPDFVVDKSLYGSADFPRTGVPLLNSEYGEGYTSLERAWHLRWQTQELRRHARYSGYVYTELADVEHENAGLLDAARRRKDWGGLQPADVNADTVLVIDLVPRAAGADIEVPTEPFDLVLHVSHHGRHPVGGRLSAEWIAAGSPLPDALVATTTVDVPPVEPFELGSPIVITIEPPTAAARLALHFVDADGAVLARSFVDAAPVELPNRRGARLGDI
ncbi:glycosyl hydrolase family 2 [Agreia sp. Leaf335]|uniref:glycoside hydrolase family 2 protein n=1 Tax=Agreia sp. Leaf335 TaxID=1736340 RepID=UPI0006FEB17D|nr:glycoside hydrolase family 2 [Agreia sp. Leaf335]KQR19167.1 glycosyl hydrolase family 2 [Agreia sp. Leaf335]